MKVKAITMPKEKAEREWKAYLALLKTRKESYLKELKDSYYHLKQVGSSIPRKRGIQND